MTMVDDPATEEPATEDPAAGNLAAGDLAAEGGAPHRWRRSWAVRVVAALVVLAVAYVGITFVQVWAASRRNDAPTSEAIVVLGAAQYNGRPSPVLEARLQHALSLFRAGQAPLIVVTGGRQVGDRFTESTTGYNWLRRHGVADAAILKEVKGRNTYESLAAVARFLKPRQVHDVILVSDATHSLRLRGVASQVGLEAHVSPERVVPHSLKGEVRALGRETAAVSLGRLIGYRRLARLVG